MFATLRAMHMPARTTLRAIRTCCAFCGTDTAERVVADTLIATLPENARFGGRLRIVQCQDCGLRYLNPRPHPDDLPAVYDYGVYQDSTNNNPCLMEHFYRTVTEHHPRAVEVLEVGCGTGEFLAYLESKGFACEGLGGFEEGHTKRFRGPMRYGFIEDVDLPEARYDVVFLLNVIEHVANPQLTLTKIRRALKPGGLLVMRHPNADLFTFPPYRCTVELPKYLVHLGLRLAGKKTGFTVGGFQNQHLFYFSQRTISRFLTRTGFDVRHVSTLDPYNAQRMRTSTFPESAIAGLRHVLGRYGLGPELLTVAQR